MARRSRLAPICLFLLTTAGCGGTKPVTATDPEIPSAPATKTFQTAAADDAEIVRVKIETTKGDVVIAVHPSWAPKGAARFIELAEAGFLDGIKFFRVVEGFMAQGGINGDPAVQAEWRKKEMADDPAAGISNQRGYVTFANRGPNTRSTQFFINFRDNSRLDAGAGPYHFTPFGVVEGDGMKVIDAFYNGYGDGPPSGNGPVQGRIQTEGNKYLEAEFPKLDGIIKATVLKDDQAAAPTDAAVKAAEPAAG